MDAPVAMLKSLPGAQSANSQEDDGPRDAAGTGQVRRGASLFRLCLLHRGLTLYQLQLKEYLAKAGIEESRPAILLSWDLNCLNLFVQAIHKQSDSPPSWIAQPVSVVSFMEDLVNHLGEFAGGRCGDVLLGPNSLEQFAQLCCRLRNVELHPFMQRCVKTLPSGHALATVYVLKDDTAAHAIHPHLPPIEPEDEHFRQLFT